MTTEAIHRMVSAAEVFGMSIQRYRNCRLLWPSEAHQDYSMMVLLRDRLRLCLLIAPQWSREQAASAIIAGLTHRNDPSYDPLLDGPY